MKILKYSLFLGVASTLIYSSSLFAGEGLDSFGSMQENLENMNPNAVFEQPLLAVKSAKKARKVKLTPEQIEELRAAGEAKRIARATSKSTEVMPFSEEELVDAPLPVAANLMQQDLGVEPKDQGPFIEQAPVVVPTEIDETTPPPTLDAEQRVQEAIEKKLEEKEATKEGMLEQNQESLSQPDQIAQQALVAEQPVEIKPVKSSKKIRKAKLTPEQIEELRAARVAKKQAAMQQEVMPFSEEELASTQPLAAENEGVDNGAALTQQQEVLADENIATPEVEQPVVAPVKKKKVSKKTKLTPEQIAAIKAGGPAKEAVIEQLKAEGAARKAKEKADAEIARKAAEEQAILSEHQDELAAAPNPEEMQQENTTTAVQTGGNRNPYAILYFTDGGSVDLNKTITEGAAFNNKGIASEPIVVDPLMGKNQVSGSDTTEAIIVKGTVDGPEVDFAKEGNNATTATPEVVSHHDEKTVDDSSKKKEEETGGAEENANPVKELLQ